MPRRGARVSSNRRLGPREDRRRAIAVDGEGGRGGGDGGLSGGEAVVQRLGNHHVGQRAVPIVLERGGDGDGHARLVGRDDSR